MNITFLIGNGFDIGLGMPTRFEDFYNEYCSDDEGLTQNIKEFKKILKNWLTFSDEKKKVTDWADFEKTFGEHSLDFKVDEKQKYLERFEHFVDAFNLYLENVEKCTDLEDGKEIGKLVNDAMRKYKIIRREDSEEIDAFYRHFNQTRVYNFVSFNYTRTVDAFYNAFNEFLKGDTNRNVGRLVHIHGYIDEAMIVGVNDSSQIVNTEFAEDPEVVDALVKPHQNEISRTGHDRDLSSLIDSSDLICVYGMSIGDTDKKWWDYISKWLSETDKRILVILQYDSKYNKRFPRVQSSFIKPILEKFLRFSSLPDNKKQEITKRIYIDFNNTVFAYKAFNQQKFKGESIATEEPELMGSLAMSINIK